MLMDLFLLERMNDLYKRYKSNELFPLFLIASCRPSVLNTTISCIGLRLSNKLTIRFVILSRTGGKRATDSLGSVLKAGTE